MFDHLANGHTQMLIMAVGQLGSVGSCSRGVAPGYVDYGLWPIGLFANRLSSIPDVLFIEFDAITIQEVPILVLESSAAVVFFLRCDIRYHVFSMCGTDREYAVTTLPVELVQVGTKRFDELRRFTFDLFDKVLCRVNASHVEQDMNMICNATNNDERRSHVT